MNARTTDSKMEQLITPLKALDWENRSAADEEMCSFLSRVAEDRKLLGELVRGLLERPENIERSQKEYGLEKYVIFNDPSSNIRLRLHRLRRSDVSLAHSHRMDFASYILAGGYNHTLYGPLDDGSDLGGNEPLSPIYVRRESAGQPYFMSHLTVHSIGLGEHDECLSLFLRSPYRKRRSLHCDRESGKRWWRYGSNERTEESLIGCSPVTRGDIDELVEHLTRREVIH